MPKYGDECPPLRELDVYTGCPYGCIYCIGSDRHDPTMGLGDGYRQVMEGKPSDLPLYLCPWTDPYPTCEEREEHTRGLLEFLSATSQPFYTVTKSPLVRRDVDLFRGNENAFIAVSINSTDDSMTSMLEPDAPSASQRMQLVEDLVSMQGVRTVVRVDPIIPTVTDGKELDRLLDWLCSVGPFAVALETLRINESICQRLRTGIPGWMFESITSSYSRIGDEAAHPRLQWRQILFRRAASKLGESDVRACFCRASLPERLTPWDCRGGY